MMIKQILNCMLLLSAASLYAAADKQITVIERTPAAVVNGMIHQGVADTPEEYHGTAMFGIYDDIDKSPYGINSLWGEPSVASGANASYTLICAQERMQQLTAEVNILEKKDSLLVTRMAALAAWGAEYARLQEQLTEQAIPGIKLCETVSATIIANGELQYSQDAIDAYKRSVLSIAMSMGEQSRLDEQAFKIQWQRYLSPSGASASASSSAGQPNRILNFFGPDPLCRLL